MRSYGVSFLIAGLVMFSAGDVSAQRTTNKEMHERINALRERLQNYQLERIREEPRKKALIEEKETVEVKFEKLVEELESRKDVAVTVLFHDEDFARESSQQIIDDVDVVARTDTDKSVEKESAITTNQMVADAASQLEAERAERREKYEALRRKVQMATRRVHDNAMQINDMLAQIPE